MSISWAQLWVFSMMKIACMSVCAFIVPYFALFPTFVTTLYFLTLDIFYVYEYLVWKPCTWKSFLYRNMCQCNFPMGIGMCFVAARNTFNCPRCLRSQEIVECARSVRLAGYWIIDICLPKDLIMHPKFEAKSWKYQFTMASLPPNLKPNTMVVWNDWFHILDIRN